MSRNSIHISIPKPCHEHWENMEATERGAFCYSCQREVIDFSAMTDCEVIEYLEKHKTGCGRFREDQLDTKLSIPKVGIGIFRWRALLLGFLSLISIKNLVAQSSEKSNNTSQTAQFDTLKKLQSNPVCLPQVEVKAIGVKREKSILGFTSIELTPMTPAKDTIKRDMKLPD